MLLGVDVGGTFTDAALLTREGLRTAKVPTTPSDQSEGVMDAVAAVLDGDPASSVERFVHGMTVGTNALLEGRVARTALLATEGFTDIEELGRQARASLYRLCAGHPPPIVPRERRVAVPERCGPEGELRELDEELLRERLGAGLGDAEAVAVCLLWGFRHPGHEERSGELAAEALPGAHVSLSCETAGVFREYERCATTVVDAALSPLLRDYLGTLSERAREGGIPTPEVMLSGGGVAPAESAAAHGSWTVLSGPAGGAVGAALAAAAADAPDAVCLDMGGTSCDVSVAVGGEAAAGGGREVGGRPLALPMVDVHTIGAGGGSIAWADPGGALRVGPRSAGAAPGPASYGRGGTEPTVTDANLVLGRLDPERPLAGVELDADAARSALARLGSELGLDIHEVAEGIDRVATAEMAQAVRVMTVERGRDPRDLALLAFGGAGPLHACGIAEELGMSRVVVPPGSGVLSAVGLVLSERRRDLAESVLLSGDSLTADAAGAVVERLAERGRAELGGAGAAALRATYDLRYAGQSWELTVPGEPRPDPAALRSEFERAHQERYGYADPDAALELVTIRVAVAEPGREPPGGGGSMPARVEGPEVIELPETTVWVAPGWAGGAHPGGALVLERDPGGPHRPRLVP